MDLKSAIRSIPDFPKKGIMFRDITTLLLDPEAFHYVIDQMEDFSRGKNVSKILAIESRGFIFGAALADRLGLGFVPIRKTGKLPGEKLRQEYELEYGIDAVEIHADALKPRESILMVDDLVATGGTLEAACKLVEKSGANVSGIAVLVDLAFLPWRQRLAKYDVLSLVKYESE
ncbi:MAG: adenine phosphoribosyltransferase [candidate division Zixibacteria bacterium]|nr:adenine phosphoribosyltransferase [candidate division Zixibacteria bacterium]